jgi:hypothetical protein
MAIYSELTQVERVNFADRALTNLLSDAEMTARMAVRGYKPPKVADGRARVTAAREEHRGQDREKGEQLGATDAVAAAWIEARRTYMTEVKLARVELAEDRGALHDLGLLGPRKRALDAALDQAHNFYISALANRDLMTKLEGIGIEGRTLQEGQARVEAVMQARATQLAETEGAQSATGKKGKALTALDKWMGPFIKVARVEFADEPQRLERLGITA